MKAFAQKWRLASLVPAALALCLGTTGAVAETYPAKPVIVVVPFSAGGSADVVARLMAENFHQDLKRSFIVENKAGATGAIGAMSVVRAAPDGYRLLLGTASVNTVLPSYKASTPYRTLRDLAPIALFASFPNMLVVHPSVPAKTVAELIAVMKANPGKYNYGSSGVGSSLHLSGELFKLLSGTKMTHIPYKGSAPALNDLLAGRIQMTFDNMTTVWPLVQQGRLRALGVTTKTRAPQAPNVPAIAETLPGYDAASWIGLFAPAKTPAAIIRILAASSQRILKKPAVAKRLTELGATVGGKGPEEFRAFIKTDLERWQRVVAEAGIGQK